MTNTQCVVIGQSPKSGSIASVLNARNVPTRAFELNGHNREPLLRVLGGEGKLKAVAVFTRGCAEESLELINGIRGSFPQVAIHVFREESKGADASFTSALKKAGVKSILSKFPIREAEIFSVLRHSHFPNLLVHSEGNEVSERLPRDVEEGSPRRGSQAEEAWEELGDEDSDPVDLSPDDSRERSKGNGGKPNRAGRRAQIFRGKPAVMVEKSKKAAQSPPPKQPQKLPVKSAAPRPLVPASPPKVVQAPSTPVDKRKWEAIFERIKRAMAEGILVKVPTLQVYPMKDQPRKYFAEMALRELAMSIQNVGQMIPGIIRKISEEGKPPRYEILDGERRWRAISFAKVEIYRAVLIEIDDEAAPFVVSSIANINREGLMPLEISDAIERLHVQLGMPIEEVAKMHNISTLWAYELHGLQNLRPSIRLMLGGHLSKEKRLAVTAAIQVSKLEKSAQEDLLEQYRSGKVSLRGLRRAALKIAASTGTYIRTRSDGPKHALRSLSRTINRARVDVQDVVDMLGEKKVVSALTFDSGEAARLDGLLGETMKSVARSREILKSLKKR